MVQYFSDYLKSITYCELLRCGGLEFMGVDFARALQSRHFGSGHLLTPSYLLSSHWNSRNSLLCIVLIFGIRNSKTCQRIVWQVEISCNSMLTLRKNVYTWQIHSKYEYTNRNVRTVTKYSDLYTELVLFRTFRMPMMRAMICSDRWATSR